MKRVIQLLPILVILASSSALAANGPGYGYGDGYGGPPEENPGQGQGPGSDGSFVTLEVDENVESQPFMRWRHRFDFVLDPVDSREAEDNHGFGEWGPSDAGNNQPGNGAPYSGPRPPH